jgi:hypothetical protein
MYEKTDIAPLWLPFNPLHHTRSAATATPRDPAVLNSTEADNTKRNSSEENKNTDTAEKQSNSKDDLEMTQKIRQAVMNDGSLFAKDGKITLKGPVVAVEKELMTMLRKVLHK